MLNGSTLKNIQYYAVYQLIYAFFVVIFDSIGAFFHFLLNHEISIVESWLHNNHWEILVFSKLIALFLLNRWFRMRLYELKSVKDLVRELVKWPEPRAFVVAAFMAVSYLSLSRVLFTGQNIGYWYFHFVSFTGLFLYFGVEFIVMAYLGDVLNQKEIPDRLTLGIAYTLLFSFSYRLSIPDYYHLFPYVILCYVTLIFLSGKTFRSWSNVLCFLLLFVAPMGSIFGLDPVWGSDFSPFRVERALHPAFLAVVWMISFCYYQYRDQILSSTRKLFR